MFEACIALGNDQSEMVSLYCFSIFLRLTRKERPLKGFSIPLCRTETNLQLQNYNITIYQP